MKLINFWKLFVVCVLGASITSHDVYDKHNSEITELPEKEQKEFYEEKTNEISEKIKSVENLLSGPVSLNNGEISATNEKDQQTIIEAINEIENVEASSESFGDEIEYEEIDDITNISEYLTEISEELEKNVRDEKLNSEPISANVEDGLSGVQYILSHGMKGDNNDMNPIAKELCGNDISEVYMIYDKFFTKNKCQIMIFDNTTRMQDQIDWMTKVLNKNEENQYIMIGHSMGGLINMGYFNNNYKRVDGFITIGTPHHGSPFATLGSAFLDSILLNCNLVARVANRGSRFCSNEIGRMLPFDFNIAQTYDLDQISSERDKIISKFRSLSVDIKKDSNTVAIGSNESIRVALKYRIYLKFTIRYISGFRWFMKPKYSTKTIYVSTNYNYGNSDINIGDRVVPIDSQLGTDLGYNETKTFSKISDFSLNGENNRFWFNHKVYGDAPSWHATQTNHLGIQNHIKSVIEEEN